MLTSSRSFLIATPFSLALFVLTSLTHAQEPPLAILRGKLSNISARTLVQSGDNIGIAGFIVDGSGKRILARGIGPSLAVGGTPLANRLANPTLSLYNASGSLITSNDDWRATQQQEIQNTGLAPSNDLESAILATLAPASYTAVLRSVSNSSGLGLIEIYDLESLSAPSELTNLSARGLVGTDDNVLIAGLIVEGGTSPQVLVRAIGPELSAANVPNVLQNPYLSLHDANGEVIQTNDDWKEALNMGEIESTGLAPTNDRESAILVVLPPANYTAIVRGVNRTTGNALAEIYRLADG